MLTITEQAQAKIADILAEVAIKAEIKNSKHTQ